MPFQRLLPVVEEPPCPPYLACALGQKACREGFNVIYRRAPRLFAEILQAKGEGRHLKFL
ncbi:MAG: ATP-binding protein, partial [Deltaproteobacteria bacterium]|nr:ATP-binding protein [Deltaproteobacteria bacterium]